MTLNRTHTLQEKGWNIRDCHEGGQFIRQAVAQNLTPSTCASEWKGRGRDTLKSPDCYPS